MPSGARHTSGAAPLERHHNLTITLYTQPACSQCTMTKKWLDDPERGNLKDQYRTVDLTQSPEDLAAIKALGYLSAPVVIVNDDDDTSNEKHWYGFRPDLLAEFCKPQAAAA